METRYCPACGGQGYLETEPGKCPVCHGEGRVSAMAPKRPTGPTPSNARVRELLGWNLLPNNRK